MAVKSGEERLKEMEAEMALWVQPLPKSTQNSQEYKDKENLDFFLRWNKKSKVRKSSAYISQR